MAASRSREVPLAATWARGVFRDPGARRRALVALGLVGAAGLLILLDAPTCPSAFFLGIPCPGCGLTRAAAALLRGDLRAAFGFHPLAFVLAPLFAGALLHALFDYVRGPVAGAARSSFWTTRAGFGIACVLFVLVLGVWLARFAGYFGGPVWVESYADFLKARFGVSP